MIHYDKDNIQKAMIDKVKNKLAGVTIEGLKKKSKAAAGLLEFLLKSVDYYDQTHGLKKPDDVAATQT